MLTFLLKHFCSGEVRLIVQRMRDFPEQFSTYQSQSVQPFTLRPSNAEQDIRWRMLVETGKFTPVESFVLKRNLTNIDIQATRKKVYEVLISKKISE